MASGTESAATNNGNRSTQLNFQKAMSDFKSMFPSIDVDVIEMVLRANNGLVDATVDQLLSMQVETTTKTDNGLLDPDLNVRLPGYDDTSSIHSANEPPPAYTPRVENDPNFQYDPTFLSPALDNFATPNHSQNTQAKHQKNTDWNPPLLGTLPTDFLRININDQSERQQARESSLHHGLSAGSSSQQHHNERISSSHNIMGRTPLSRAEGSRHHPHSYKENVNGFDAIPNATTVEPKPKSSEGKSKKFGQMSRKFKRTKKTKTTKCPKNEYKPIAFANLVDEDSSDEGNAKR